jgi:hypothetical protein
VGQVVTAWSVGDLITLADKLSQTDRARAFFDDPENVISGQGSLRLDLYSSSLVMSALLIPYPMADRIKDGAHPYSIAPGLEVETGQDRLSPEAALRLSLENERGSVAILAGRVNNRQPILELEPGALPRAESRHEPYTFLGVTTTLPRDPLLLKAELIYDRHRPWQTALDGRPAGLLRADTLGLMLGLELNAGRLGSLTLELADERAIHHDSRLLGGRDRWRAALSWSDAYLNDSLRLRATAILLESTRNMIARIDLSRSITSSLIVSARLSTFIIGDRLDIYRPIRDADRADLVVEIGF